MRGSIDEGDVRFTSGKRNKFKRASSITEMASQSEEELDAIRNAVIASEGLLLSVFDVLRRVPRRVLMVLKLNDLTRCMWFPFLAQPVIHYPNCLGIWIMHLRPPIHRFVPPWSWRLHPMTHGSPDTDISGDRKVLHLRSLARQSKTVHR
jgi:hypothetical protein